MHKVCCWLTTMLIAKSGKDSEFVCITSKETKNFVYLLQYSIT